MSPTTVQQPQVPADGVVIDHLNRVVLFGDETEEGRRFHQVANLCRQVAEDVGAGAEVMANVLVQVAAYHLGAEYDTLRHRDLLAVEMARVLRAKAERAVHEVEETGFRLPGGDLDTDAGRYVDSGGRARFAAGSPMVELFGGLAWLVREFARGNGIAPAELASTLMATAGYHVGSTCSDADRRRRWLDALVEAFVVKLTDSPELGRRDRARHSEMPPCHGWRGGTEYHETDPRRGHPPAVWLR